MTARQNNPAPVDILAGLQNPEDVFRNPGQLAFMRQLVDTIRRGFSSMISRETAAPEFFLQAPGGKVFRITVSDAGALTATHVQG